MNLKNFKKYVFAASHSSDFEVEGENPLDAYNRLVEREKGKGQLWQLFDQDRNRFAVARQGFKWLGNPNEPSCTEKGFGCVYKEIGCVYKQIVGDEKESLTFEDVLDNVKDVIQNELDGDEIARIHNEICKKKIRYIDDSVWAYTGETDE